MSVSAKGFFPYGFSFILLLALLLSGPSGHADTAQYSYDELGRLTQVANGSAITNYSYDEVGNILSVSNGSLADVPSITGIDITTLLVGVRTPVVFTGQNLLSAGSVISLGGNISINSVIANTDRISAILTAKSEGVDTIKVSFKDNSNYAYQSDVAAVASTIVMTPPVLATPPNSVAVGSLSLNPPLSFPLTVGLKTGDISIATVPASITIPAGGSAPLNITTKSLGITNITSLNNVIFGYVLSEHKIGGNGVSSTPVSVSIALPDPSAPSVGTSSQISVSIQPSVQPPIPSVCMSAKISVSITPSIQAVEPSLKSSKPVSVSIEPSVSSVNPSVTVSPRISVKISQ